MQPIYVLCCKIEKLIFFTQLLYDYADEYEKVFYILGDEIDELKNAYFNAKEILDANM